MMGVADRHRQGVGRIRLGESAAIDALIRAGLQELGQTANGGAPQ